MPTVQSILDAEIPAPSWAWRPSTAAPLRSEMSFTRSTAKWALSPQQRFEEKLAGEPVIGGPDAGFIRAPQFTQLLPDSTTLSGASWGQTNVTVTEDAGTALGQPYDEIRETTATGLHRILNSGFTSSDGADLSVVLVARPAGRDWVRLFSNLNLTSDDSNQGSAYAEFNLATGAVQNKTATDAAIAATGVSELAGGWVQAELDVNIDAGIYASQIRADLLQSAGTDNYTGVASRGIDVIVANIQEGTDSAAPPAFATGDVNQDQADFTISDADFNYNRGTYFFEVVPRIYHAASVPQIANLSSFNVHFSPASPLKAKCLDFSGANNQFIASPTNDLTPYDPVRVAVTFSEGGEWALSVNGDYIEKSNHVGGVLARPAPGNFYDVSNKGTVEYREVSYIPARLTKLQLQSLTS